MGTVTADYDHAGVFTRERVLTAVLALMTLVALYVCYLLISPFIPAVAFALALAVSTQRPYTWLRRKLPNGAVTAALAVALIALLVIAPAAFLTTYIVQMSIESIR
ncbi:MAG TPA: hypothetical protein VES20_18890, partial [Bryobacteraceae bacterium]|nr:hypothetical protein [Bryobacteraceae bacterium]